MQVGLPAGTLRSCACKCYQFPEEVSQKVLARLFAKPAFSKCMGQAGRLARPGSSLDVCDGEGAQLAMCRAAGLW